MRTTQIEKEILDIVNDVKIIINLNDRHTKSYMLENKLHEALEKVALIKYDRLTDDERIIVNYD